MKKNKIRITAYLNNINTFFIILTILVNLVAAFFTAGDKTKYTLTSLYLNSLLLFWYNTTILKEAETHLNEMKRETMYINYPVRIAAFFVVLGLLMVGSFITLSVMSKTAANPALAFTFFMSIISMLMPSVVFTVAIYFIYPAVIIPGYTIKNLKENLSKKVSAALLIILLLLGFLKLIHESYRKTNLMRSDKYKTAIMNVGYSSEFLKTDSALTAYARKLLGQEKVNTPFLYTEDYFTFDEREDAEIFCKSIGGRLPNHLEMYHIIFNKFETFGDNYFLTKNKDGNKDLVVHFKNMSYTVERASEELKPRVYCVADIDSGYKQNNNTYLIKTNSGANNDKLNAMSSQKFDLLNLKGLMNGSKNNNMSGFFNMTDEINTEKKHVNFSVKEVSPEIFSKLVASGYSYNPASKLSRAYESNDTVLKAKLNKDKTGNNEIRLCYYPFIDYSGVSRKEEEQIWSKSFCSPAFVLINNMPETKTYKEAVNYCDTKGGRLPNLPELYGILRTYDISIQNAKYWTNTVVSSPAENGAKFVKVINTDGRFAKVLTISEASNESANTYCITAPNKTSRVIANYSSRFKGVTASQYADKLCPKCTLYEVPDVTLQ